MLTLPNPKRLLSGYLLGALLTSITCGLLLVFLLPGSKTATATKHTVNPVIDCTLAVLILLIIIRVARGRDRRRRAWRERRVEKARNKPPPRWKRALNNGSARDTFIVGILLSFPGASYVAGMDELSRQHLSTFATVIAVLVFNLIMFLLLEIPLVAYAIRPDATEGTVQRFSDMLTRDGGRIALIGAPAIVVFSSYEGSSRY